MATEDAIELASLAAAKRFDDPRVCEWVARGFCAFGRVGGVVPMERLFGLPTTEDKLAIARRNVWLRAAAQEVDSAAQLARELDTFLTRGPWRLWKDLQSPPTATSRLRTALFHVARSNGGEGLSERTVGEITRSVFAKTLRRASFIIDAPSEKEPTDETDTAAD